MRETVTAVNLSVWAPVTSLQVKTMNHHNLFDVFSSDSTRRFSLNEHALHKNNTHAMFATCIDRALASWGMGIKGGCSGQM